MQTKSRRHNPQKTVTSEAKANKDANVGHLIEVSAQIFVWYVHLMLKASCHELSMNRIVLLCGFGVNNTP